MAGKKRDYKAEERRRNELAVAKYGSFAKNRYQVRKLREAGTLPFALPQRVKAPKSVAAANRRLATLAKAKAKAKPASLKELYGGTPKKVFDAAAETVGVSNREAIAVEWDKINSRSNAARFLPDGADKGASRLFRKNPKGEKWPEGAEDMGISRDAYVEAYLAAFVYGEHRYDKVRHSGGGSAALYYWFVTLNHYYTTDEYEQRYGPIG